MRSIVLLVTTICFCAAFTAPIHAGECGFSDLDFDGTVGSSDLLALLSDWGSENSPADLDGDGYVNAADLLILLSNWGPTDFLAGGFPEGWINGGPNCPGEPVIQIHQYNQDMYILRQSLCTNFEGPFIYLLFGQDKVLMQDTGAGGIPIADTVYGIIDDWLARNGKQSIDLIVSHSHSHGDHIQGDPQFQGQPNTTVVPLTATAVADFFGISDWPNDIVEYDLGERIIDVIAIPGHQVAHIALYDRQTGNLFTGDTLYPGRLYISQFPTYVQSIQRLVTFMNDKTVCNVLGTHIEMTNTAGEDYNFGATYHPDEHRLQLDRSHLLELLDGVIKMQDDPHIEVHDDFIIYPL